MTTREPPPRTELEAHIATGLPDNEIGAIYGVTHADVFVWRLRYRIERDVSKDLDWLCKPRRHPE